MTLIEQVEQLAALRARATPGPWLTTTINTNPRGLAMYQQAVRATDSGRLGGLPAPKITMQLQFVGGRYKTRYASDGDILSHDPDDQTVANAAFIADAGSLDFAALAAALSASPAAAATPVAGEAAKYAEISRQLSGKLEIEETLDNTADLVLNAGNDKHHWVAGNVPVEYARALADAWNTYSAALDYAVTGASGKAQENWESFWESICSRPDGTPDFEQIKLELRDYHGMMHEVSKVYDTLTMGRISKPNTLASAVISEVEEIQQRDFEEWKKEAMDEATPAPAASVAAPDTIERLHEADAMLEADGYKTWGYVRLAISEALKALSAASVAAVGAGEAGQWQLMPDSPGAMYNPTTGLSVVTNNLRRDGLEKADALAAELLAFLNRAALPTPTPATAVAPGTGEAPELDSENIDIAMYALSQGKFNRHQRSSTYQQMGRAYDKLAAIKAARKPAPSHPATPATGAATVVAAGDTQR